MPVHPYLFFDGNCEEAIGFYRRTLGAEVNAMMRYKESPDTPPPGMMPENWGDKIMHANLTIAGSTLMASDAPNARDASFAGFSLSIDLDDEAKAERVFQALAEGGEVKMPLMKTFFARRFGMLADRFGVGWMIHVA